MSWSSAPARYANARPSPVYSQLFAGYCSTGAPNSASGQHYCLCLPQLKAAFLAVVSASSGNSISVEQQTQHRALHVDFHPGVDAVILKCTYHLQAGAVADMCQPGISVSAEVSLQNLAVRRAVEKRAPCLEFEDALRRLFLRAVRPSASCSDTVRRASYRRNGHASCRDRRHFWPVLLLCLLSAITVCALPSSDLQTTTHLCTSGSGFDRCAQACSACSNPRSTSYENRWNSGI